MGADKLAENTPNAQAQKFGILINKRLHRASIVRAFEDQKQKRYLEKLLGYKNLKAISKKSLLHCCISFCLTQIETEEEKNC